MSYMLEASGLIPIMPLIPHERLDEGSFYPHASHQVSVQRDLLFGRRCDLKNFKMAAILDIGKEGF